MSKEKNENAKGMACLPTSLYDRTGAPSTGFMRPFGYGGAFLLVLWTCVTWPVVRYIVGAACGCYLLIQFANRMDVTYWMDKAEEESGSP